MLNVLLNVSLDCLHFRLAFRQSDMKYRLVCFCLNLRFVVYCNIIIPFMMYWNETDNAKHCVIKMKLTLNTNLLIYIESYLPLYIFRQLLLLNHFISFDLRIF